MSDTIWLATAEVASVLREYLDHNDDTMTNVARRAGVNPRALYRVMRCETTSTTVDVAEKLLQAAGRDLSDCPSYYNEGWTLQQQEEMREKLRANARKQSRRWRHGTQYGYAKGCRCRECSEAQRHKNRIGNALRARKKPPREKHVHPVLCSLRGMAPAPMAYHPAKQPTQIVWTD